MNIRLRYIRNDKHFINGKVYYFKLIQRPGLQIQLFVDRQLVATYPNLESFLRSWKILAIKKELKRVKAAYL